MALLGKTSGPATLSISYTLPTLCQQTTATVQHCEVMHTEDAIIAELAGSARALEALAEAS